MGKGHAEYIRHHVDDKAIFFVICQLVIHYEFSKLQLYFSQALNTCTQLPRCVGASDMLFRKHQNTFWASVFLTQRRGSILPGFDRCLVSPCNARWLLSSTRMDGSWLLFGVALGSLWLVSLLDSSWCSLSVPLVFL